MFSLLEPVIKMEIIYVIILDLLMDWPGVSSNTYGMLLLGHL